MSIGLLLRSVQDAVIWRGPMKYNAIGQLLRDVEWGDLDVLVVDCPPGTGDEPLAVVQQMGTVNGAILVTTPQQLAVNDVRRSAGFCQQLNLPVLGVVENMSGFICPHCGERSDIFSSGGGAQLAREAGLALLGSIPIDGRVVMSGDNGEPIVKLHPESEPAQVFSRIAGQIIESIRD
jgi:ATP-binding protein involved in chromosome partitioning